MKPGLIAIIEDPYKKLLISQDIRTNLGLTKIRRLRLLHADTIATEMIRTGGVFQY